MRVNYCDLCGQPIKERTQIILLKFQTSESVTQMSYTSFLDVLEKSMKEICPTCSIIIDEIFKLRLNNLTKLSNDLLAIYKTPLIDKDKKNKGKDNEKPSRYKRPTH